MCSSRVFRPLSAEARRLIKEELVSMVRQLATAAAQLLVGLDADAPPSTGAPEHHRWPFRLPAALASVQQELLTHAGLHAGPHAGPHADLHAGPHSAARS